MESLRASTNDSHALICIKKRELKQEQGRRKIQLLYCGLREYLDHFPWRRVFCFLENPRAGSGVIGDLKLFSGGSETLAGGQMSGDFARQQ